MNLWKKEPLPRHFVSVLPEAKVVPSVFKKKSTYVLWELKIKINYNKKC